MSPRDRIRHLYRHLAFGATPAEVEASLQEGFEATRKRIVDYPKAPSGPSADPNEFVWRKDQDPDTGAQRYRAWWVAQMVATSRPLQERLAIFWHDHFAVSDAKVNSGPMMLGYLQTIRGHAEGKFGDLLVAVSKEPAMMRWLDMNRSIRGVPNENFAREVMELFTLGIGHYTEKDVQEVARAFTGWGFSEIYRDLPGDATQKLKDSILYDRPFAAFYHSPALHDPSPKTILGRTDRFDGDSFLQMLAKHPQTARMVCEKLWGYFAYENPDPKTLEPIVATWKRTDGDILAVVDAISRHPEFYSDRCVRGRIKSPPELVVSIARQMGMGTRIYADRASDASPTSSVPQSTSDAANDVARTIARMGMPLFYPPDVAGWDWGIAWISPALMTERLKFRGFRQGAQGVYEALAPLKPTTTEELATHFVALFDVPLDEKRLKPIVEAMNRVGGVKALAKPATTANLVAVAMPILMAAPETHLC